MDKNPFSLYDFMGYFFPGAFALILIYFFVEHKIEIQNVSSLYADVADMFKFRNSEDDKNFTIEICFVFIVVSYIVGHFAAYLSSLTVEHFSKWLYGYPSTFLLYDVAPGHYWNINTAQPPAIFATKLLWRVLTALFLLPLSLGSIILSKVLGLKHFFIKKLDPYLIRNIQNSYYLLMKKKGLKGRMNEHVDYHRVIYHYVYEYQKQHTVKLDNYVALYGFLRSITFIFNCVSLYFTYLWYDNPCKDLFSLCLISYLVTYIFFMSFIKFYRRFTLESFMCLVTDDRLALNKAETEKETILSR